MTSKGLAKKFGPIDPEFPRPSLGIVGVTLVDPETEHCHTLILQRMTLPRSVPERRLLRGRRVQICGARVLATRLR